MPPENNSMLCAFLLIGGLAGACASGSSVPLLIAGAVLALFLGFFVTGPARGGPGRASG